MKRVILPGIIRAYISEISDKNYKTQYYELKEESEKLKKNYEYSFYERSEDVKSDTYNNLLKYLLLYKI